MHEFIENICQKNVLTLYFFQPTPTCWPLKYFQTTEVHSIMKESIKSVNFSQLVPESMFVLYYYVLYMLVYILYVCVDAVYLGRNSTISRYIFIENCSKNRNVTKKKWMNENQNYSSTNIRDATTPPCCLPLYHLYKSSIQLRNFCDISWW